MDLRQKFEDSVNKLTEYCEFERNHFDFLNESDLKCFLYEELVAGQKLEDLKSVYYKVNTKISPVHSELQYGFENEDSKICDLALIDCNEVKFEVETNKRGRPHGIFRFSKVGIKKSVIVELGYSWGKSKHAKIAQIKKDCKKLDAAISNRYVVYLDMGKLDNSAEFLINKDLEELEVNGVKLYYITRDGNLIKK